MILVQVGLLDPNTNFQIAVMTVIDKFLGDMVTADIDAVATEIGRNDLVEALKRLIVIVLEVYDVEIRYPDLAPHRMCSTEKVIMVE